MHALILAAGEGSRLRPHTANLPKALVPLAGRPMISHVFESLAGAGIDNSTVVVGRDAAMLRAELPALCPRGMTLRFVENAAHHLANARSIWEARNAVGEEGFVLAMADHIVEASIIAAVTRGARDRCRLAVDRVAPDDPRAAEATRVRVSGTRVADLGKSLSEWNALDTGVFWCAPDIFDALTPDLRDGEAGAVFSSLARAARLDAVDVTGSAWIDIDTPADLRAAEERLASVTRA